MTVRHDSTIILSRADYERLSALVSSRQAADTWPGLVSELDRAEVVDSSRVPDTAVTMGSEVEYREENTGQRRRVVLVFPGQEDIAAGRISILTPIGTALIGLRVGESTEWQTRSGEWKRLSIVRVEHAATGGASG